MKIIGITGTIGAGKGVVVEYMVKEKGFKHFSAREFLTEEVIKRGLPINRDSMLDVANEFRAKHSPSYVIDQLYLRAKEHGGNIILESIRHPIEIESARKNGNFHLLGIDANPTIRYERIIKRGLSTDKISFEEFIEHDRREMYSDDPAKACIGLCIDRADFKIINEGNFHDLHTAVNDALNKMMLK